MRIEVLFPEVCSLFGDIFNVVYLERCLPQVERVNTALTDEPKLEPGGLIYLGPMSERTQEKVIERLRPYRARLEERIEDGTAMLFTGNAMEVLGDYIENEDGQRIEGLGLLPLWAKRDLMHRHNSVFLGSWQGQEVMGFKSQFTMAWPGEEVQGLFPVKKGVGLNPQCPFEGLRKNNLFCSYLQGPLLPLNPGFAKNILDAMGAPQAPLAFEKEAREACRQRLVDLHKNLHV